MTDVRRSLARETMLGLAQEAETAMTVIRRRDDLTAAVGDERIMFRKAVELFLRQANGQGTATERPDLDWLLRSESFTHAANVLRFCEHMGMPLDFGRNVEELYRSGLAEIRPSGAGTLTLDRLSEVTITHLLVRSLRSIGAHHESLRRARLDPEFYFGSGAEPRIADVQFEAGACLLSMGQPDQVFTALGESERSYWETPEAASHTTRHRYSFILALAHHARYETGSAIQRLDQALDHLLENRVPDTRHLVYELSLTLTLAEVLATAGSRPKRTIALAEKSLDITERIRERWGVIARTRTPLSMAIRRVYGDIALLVASVTRAHPKSRAAARIGLRVCLSAKQTGFAGHLRAGEQVLPPRIRGLVAQALNAESMTLADPTGATAELNVEQRQQQEQTLGTLRRQIERRLNSMLADMIVPTPTDISHLLRTIGDRHALDFAGLPHSLDNKPRWFRTLITPDDTIRFNEFEPGEHFGTYFVDRDGETPWVGSPDAAGQLDWHGLAREILPPELLRRLRNSCSRERPISLLISAHRELSLLPWPALEVDDDGTRLLHRAVLTHTPALTCLSRPSPPVVSGPALVRLVSDLWIKHECEAWGLNASDGAVPLSRCELGSESPRATRRQQLSAELMDPEEEWRFIHIAAHGDGSGLDQHLHLPEETKTDQMLTAAHALALRWPESTLMASCHLGKIVNVADAEPLGFVMAVLTGGSACVVAAIDEVDDLSASRLARHLVQSIRSGDIRLDHALRRAQLAIVDAAHEAERDRSWARFNTYVR